MKAYKLEVLVVDFDELGPEIVHRVLEDTRYTNYCISPRVLSIAARDIGEWHDDHPLNAKETTAAEVQRLFGTTQDAA